MRVLDLENWQTAVDATPYQKGKCTRIGKTKNKKNKKENLNESQEKTGETAQEQRKQQQTLLSIMKIEIKINQM